MLTVRQTLIASGQKSRSPLRADLLPRKLPGRPLSLAKAAAALGEQRRIMYLGLISPKVFNSEQVNSFEDLFRVQHDLSVRMSESETNAFKDYLESHGLLLRLVDKSFSSCAIVGSTSAMSAVPVVPLNPQSFLTIKDVVTGGKDIATGAIAVGGVIVAAGAAPTVVGISVQAAPFVFFTGAAIVLAGATIFIVGGLIEISEDAPIQSAPSGPQDGGTSEADSVDIPDAIAIGDPPNGFDGNAVLADLGNLALDLTLADIPVGWDSDAGVALPGFGGDGLGGDTDGGDGGIFGGLPV